MDHLLFPRQLVPNILNTNDDSRTSRARLCQPVNLPANGVLRMPGGEIITLSESAIFTPSCVPNTTPAIIAGAGGTTNTGVDDATHISGPQFSDLSDPFYASTFPQCYALAATTVVAYTLVIMLVITPRSFLDGGVVVLGRRGFTSGGPGYGIIGGRPWLQKVAALTVAISLTIATADTFRVAEEQYALGLQNARELQDNVLNGTELKIIRIVSDTFLWLAQAQTLIRLFPRQREKVIIKWTAFALITFDLIFDSLNSFQFTGPGNSRPGSFTDAIPALSYLFQLALGVLYAAWVIYYSLMKKKYAYYHPQMKNICLVAGLSLLSILVPVVFFILDIRKPEFTGWGDYVRWVGAAAASVIVWEWVERIEALEREEKRNGILGREVFDGDEMLETPSDSTWPRRNRIDKSADDVNDDADGGESGGDDAPVSGRRRSSRESPQTGGDAQAATGRSNIWPSMSLIAKRYRSRPANRKDGPTIDDNTPRQPTNHNRPAAARFLQPPLWPSRPPPAVTPVSRTDTASADSTVYAIRYHPLTDVTSRATTRPTPPPPGAAEPPDPSGPRSASPSPPSNQQSTNPQEGLEPVQEENGRQRRPSGATGSRVGGGDSSAWHSDETLGTGHGKDDSSRGGRDSASAKRWRTLAQSLPFRRNTRTDEEAGGHSTAHSSSGSSRHQRLQIDDTEQTGSRWDIRTRMEDFAATQAERIRERIRPTPDTDSLPVMVIPAPARRGAALAQLLEEDEPRNSQVSTQNQRQGSLASPTSPIEPWRRRNSTGSTPSVTGAGPLVSASGGGPGQGSAGNGAPVP